MQRPLVLSNFSFMLAALLPLAGCQTYVQKDGLTLPSPRYLQHPPQYVQPRQPQPVPMAAPLPPAVAVRPVPAPALPPVQPAQPPGKDTYVAELLDLLAQTKSVDAFLVTAELLAAEKAAARQIIPSVIRHAERLGIYGRHAFAEGGSGAEVAQRVTELVAQMSKVTITAPGKKSVWQRTTTKRPEAAGDSAEEATAEQRRTPPSPAAPGRSAGQADCQPSVLPPLHPGQKPTAKSPSKAEVLKALPRRVQRVLSGQAGQGNDIDITWEKVADVLNPLRFYPLVGPAQLHQCHWKYTVHFTEVLSGSWPLPFEMRKRRSEVVYLDRNRLHLCVPEELQGATANSDIKPPKKKNPKNGAVEAQADNPYRNILPTVQKAPPGRAEPGPGVPVSISEQAPSFTPSGRNP